MKTRFSLEKGVGGPTICVPLSYTRHSRLQQSRLRYVKSFVLVLANDQVVLFSRCLIWMDVDFS